MALVGAALWLAGAAPLAALEIAVAGLRSQKGLVQVCVTRDPKHFPACDHDPASRRLTVPAAQAAKIVIADLPPGDYAVLVAHDENANGRIDTRFGIPTEGVGFSNNPQLYFGPPSFAAAHIVVGIGAGPTITTVKLHYFF